MKLSDSIRLINRRQRARLIWKTGISADSLRGIFVRIVRTSWDECEMHLGRSGTRLWDVKSFGDVPAAGMPAVPEDEEYNQENDGQSADDDSDCETCCFDELDFVLFQLNQLVKRVHLRFGKRSDVTAACLHAHRLFFCRIQTDGDFHAELF